MVSHWVHSMKLDFVRDTIENDLQWYGHLVKFLSKITLMKLTTNSPSTDFPPKPWFLISHCPVGTFNQMSHHIRLLQASTCPNPDLSSFPIKLVVTLGSLLQFKYAVIFYPVIQENPVLPNSFSGMSLSLCSYHSNHTAQAFPSSGKSCRLPPGYHISHVTLVQKPLITLHCPDYKIQNS